MKAIIVMFLKPMPLRTASMLTPTQPRHRIAGIIVASVLIATAGCCRGAGLRSRAHVRSAKTCQRFVQFISLKAPTRRTSP